MDETMVEQLQGIDPDALAEIVRQDQRDPAFKILDWSVTRLSSQGIMNPDALWRYSGTGLDGNGSERAWTVVLKRITNLQVPEDLRSIWYEMRDALVYESGLLKTLPQSVAVPRCYGVWHAADACSIWLEYIQESAPQRWTMTEYAAAANALGRMSGPYLASQAMPDYPWLCREHGRYWVQAVDPALDWQNPYVQKYISPSLRARYERLLPERERFFAAMDRLPQVFSHFDFHRRNLKMRLDGNGDFQTVLFDWTLAGIGPVGGDLFALVGINTAMFETTVQELPELERVALEQYTAGMHACGALVDRETIRLGYQLFGGVYIGTTLPAFISFWTSEMMRESARTAFGAGLDELAESWAVLGEFYICHAEQALATLASRT